jgi:uncharacterized membrane protein
VSKVLFLILLVLIAIAISVILNGERHRAAVARRAAREQHSRDQHATTIRRIRSHEAGIDKEEIAELRRKYGLFEGSRRAAQSFHEHTRV